MGGADSTVSPNRTTFGTLCSANAPYSRTATFVTVDAGSKYTVYRETPRIDRSDNNFVGCTAATSGTASMIYFSPAKRSAILTVGDGRPHTIILPRKGGPWGAATPRSLSPSGRQAVLVGYYGGLYVANLASGSNRSIHIPTSIRRWNLDAGSSYDGVAYLGQASYPAWVAPHTIVTAPGPNVNHTVKSRVALLNPVTGRWSNILTVGPVQAGMIYCSLASGRTLVASGPQIGPYLTRFSIFISNQAGTKVTAVRTAQLGPIYDI